MPDNMSGAKTLERGLGLLDHVANNVTRLDDIARAAGLSRSSTHRMLTSLVNSGFLAVDTEHRYRLGIKLLQLGSQAHASIDVSRGIQVALDEVSARTHDATHLGVLIDTDILYLAKARGSRGIEMMSRPGIRLRAQNTAMGKMLLSTLSDDEAARRFDPEAVPTPNSARSVDDFLAGLARTRKRGFAVENQENELGVTCVAIGVPDRENQFAAAISVSAPSVHLPARRYPEVVGYLRSIAPTLSPLLPAGFESHWGSAPIA
jgi:IclR family acetate operon transcriptional repressor